METFTHQRVDAIGVNMDDNYVAEAIATHMDSMFDDENGAHWGAYVDSSGRIQMNVQDSETDEIAYFTLTVSEHQ